MNPATLSAAVRRRQHARSLLECPVARPLPAQEEIVAAALALAEQHGLTIPTDLFIGWVEADEFTSAHGLTIIDARGTVEVLFSVTAMPERLHELAIHEAQHVHDVATGLHRRLSPEQLEHRALNFAHRVLGWRA